MSRNTAPKLLAAMIALIIDSTIPADADPLDDLIKFRTGWHGESCTRHENSAVCTLGKSTGNRAIYLKAPDIYGKFEVGTPEAARSMCEKVDKAGLKLFVASFVPYEGEVILNCVLHKAAP